MSWRRRKKLLFALILFGCVLSAGFIGKADAANNPMLSSKIEMAAPVDFKDATNKVYNLNYDDVSIRQLLRQLARAANVNILLDKSVEGSVTLSLNDVSVREALEYLRNVAGLYYATKGDNILYVTAADTAQEKGLTKNITKFIPVKYVNAKLVSSLLNNTVFKTSGESDSSEKTATPEFRTNSVILVGNSNDIRLAEDVISRIDSPRESKTFKINHAQAIEVAQLLQATVFNDGVSPFGGASAGSGGEEGGLPSSPSPVSVSVETFEEGSGSATEIEGGSGGQQSFSLRKKTLATLDLPISPEGPVLVPDGRTNTLTIMGTIEQIALAESIIPSLDQKLPQVAIETSLIEVFETGIRELKPTVGTSDGQFAFGFDNTTISETPTAGTPAAAFRPTEPTERQRIGPNGEVVSTFDLPGVLNNVIGLPTNRTKGQEGMEFAWTTIPIERSSQVLLQLDAVIAKRKAKLLANPTVIAVHNTEAVVSITEEIIRSTQITRDATGFLQTQVEIGEAGIILSILPKVGGDGFVTMRIRPSVSTIANKVTDSLGNEITLLNRRDMAVQEARIANGQTLALGGLIQESDISSHAKIPGLGDLPIIGAMFRTQFKDLKRSELIMLVTPRIMEDAYPISPASRISSLMNDPDFKSMMSSGSKRQFKE